MPTKSEVGVQMLPDTIASVQAPFKTIQFRKQQFTKAFVIANLSNERINTKAIQQAIDGLSSRDGGTVIIPEGEWLTGRIELKSNICLHLEDGTVLVFSGEIEDYQPAVFTRIEGIEVMSLGACIYANSARNIAITGKGRIIGPAEGSVRKKIFIDDVIENVVDLHTPVAERIVDGISTPWIFPPMLISPINCTQVYIEGISLENTAFWNVVPIYCDKVIIRGVKVHSVGIPRGDGIDVESSKNVLIEYCTLSTEDDCFTMKAGRGHDGVRVDMPTENVVVRYCLALKGDGGITCGSETAGMIRNLYVHDCVFENSHVGIRFKTRRPRGGGGENLYYERIRLSDQRWAFKWDMLGSRTFVGDLAQRLPAREVNELTPAYQNIYIKDILVENTKDFIQMVGIPESPVTNLNVENCEVNCQRIISAQDLSHAAFKNIRISTADSVLKFNDARNVSFCNVQFDSANEIVLRVSGENSGLIRMEKCTGINAWRV